MCTGHVVSWQKIERWAWQSRRQPGSRTARRAWRNLVAEGDAGNRAAIDQVWRIWTEDLDDESWSCLVRWREQDELLGAVFALAETLPAALRERLVDFCSRHGLAPVDPAERAVYFLLNRRQDQYEALDPDGSLLVAGYFRAQPEVRAALRTALTGSGGMGLIRLITEDTRTIPAAAEIEDVARGLAADGQWTRLWRLICDLRLDQATRAVRFLGDWRPADQESRELADRLAATDPAVVEAVVQSAWTRIEVRDPIPTAAHVSVAPDGSELAVFDRARVSVHAVPDGHEIATFDREDGFTIGPVSSTLKSLLKLPDPIAAGSFRHLPGRGGAGGVHLGDVVVYLENGNVVRRSRPDWRAEHVSMHGERLTAMPGGYAVDGRELVFGDATGHRTVMSRGYWVRGGVQLVVQAVEPESGRLAVTAEDDLDVLFLVGRDGAVLDRTTTWAGQYRFFGPERLVAVGVNGLVRSWRVDDGRLAVATSRDLDGSVWFSDPAGPLKLIPRDDPANPVWLDPVTLEPVTRPEETAAPLATVPGGTHAVFRVDGGVALCDLRLGDAAEVLTRPLAHLGPVDLAAVSAAAARAAENSAPGVVLNLLLDCLHHRVGTEIGVGPISTRAADDDIQLGG